MAVTICSVSPHGSENSLKAERDNPGIWQEAQDRVLLYLKKLGMPAILGLEIAHEALQKAQEIQSVNTGAPVQLAMRAMHRILHNNPEILRHTAHKEYSILYRRWQLEILASHSRTSTESGADLEWSASPPINRGSMMIKKI